MTSKSFMTATGLKKCNPPNRSILSGVDWAISLIDSEDVFDAKIVLGGAILSYPENSFCFSSKFSVTASTTKSAVVKASSGVIAVVNLLQGLR